MKEEYLLEVCVDSVESAIAAKEGGGDRLELCSSLITGGITPSISLFTQIKKYVELPIHVLIRPRFGDFLYSQYEYEVMKEDIRAFRLAGAEGVVIGCLQSDGTIDKKQMKGLLQETGGMRVTLHRAFDMVEDPKEALKVVKELGIDTILTSGQEDACYDGRSLLEDLVELAGEDVTILAGSGVTPHVIDQMLEETKVRNFHMSGKEIVNSQMQYRNDKVHMGIDAMSEYEMFLTHSENVRAAKEILLQFKNH